MTMNWRRTISTLAAALPLAASVHAYGTTAPVGSTTDNAVDVHSTARYSLADTGKVAGGAVAQYEYPSGLGRYSAGTIVKGTDQSLYQCRPDPNAVWCNQAPLSYAPGSGRAWSEAWSRMP